MNIDGERYRATVKGRSGRPMSPRASGLALFLLLVAQASPDVQARRASKTAKLELPPTQQTITVVGFCDGGKEVILDIVDENIGSLYQVRDVRRGKVIASYPYADKQSRRAWRTLKRKHSVQSGFADSPDNAKRRVTMLSSLGSGAIRVLVMRGETIKPYTTIPLFVGRDNQVAEAFVKQIVWDARGKYAVIIYHQAVEGRLTWRGDFMHGIKYKSYRAGFDEGS